MTDANTIVDTIGAPSDATMVCDGQTAPNSTAITVVSGYPRSGTSLMMQMLAAGGLSVLTDDCKRPDTHNPRGYFEYEPALKLGREGATTEWVAAAQGMAVKVIAYQMQHLPRTFDYQVIFMKRTIAEVLASWRKMSLTRADVHLTEREQILAFKTEYAIYEARLVRHPNMRVLFLHYNELLTAPHHQIARIRDLLALPLDMEAMETAIDPALYRNRF